MLSMWGIIRKQNEVNVTKAYERGAGLEGITKDPR